MMYKAGLSWKGSNMNTANYVLSSRPKLTRELYALISWDLFNLIQKVALVKSDNESFGKEPVSSGKYVDGFAPFLWLFFAEKHSWQKWFLKGKMVRRNILRITYIEPRILNGVYVVNKSDSLKCELFRDSPEIRHAVESMLGPQAFRLGVPDIKYIDMSNDPSAWYPGKCPELPKARLLNV